MKSLERRYNNLIRKNPHWSTYTCFSQALRDQQFSRQTIHRWFNKLVDKNDYASAEKKDIHRYLEELSKGTYDNQNWK